MTLPTIAAVHPPGTAAPDQITLAHDERQVRRRRLVSAGGQAFMADFAELTVLLPEQVLELSDGAHIRVQAAAETLLHVTGDLPRLAWHIGNRHAPCQILRDALLVRADAPMARMLAGLGAQVTPLSAPFAPEGGAYGHAHAG